MVAFIAVAAADGFNDTIKGVARLMGSGTASFRAALHWRTVTTVLGFIAALWLARSLLTPFSGEGPVPDALARSDWSLAPVSARGAITAYLASRIGMPVSTTQALMGATVARIGSRRRTNCGTASSGISSHSRDSQGQGYPRCSVWSHLRASSPDRWPRDRQSSRPVRATCLRKGSPIGGSWRDGEHFPSAVLLSFARGRPTTEFASQVLCKSYDITEKISFW